MTQEPRNLVEVIFQCLDTDRETAEKAFGAFIDRLFVRIRPYHYGAWTRAGFGDEVAELVSKLYIHCSDDNFRRLRRFQFAGVPDERRFRSWLLQTTDRLLIVDLRRARTRRETVTDPDDMTQFVDARPRPDEAAESIQHVRIIEDAIAAARPRDRDMLRYRIDGRKAGDVAREEWGSNDLRVRKRASAAMCDAVERCAIRLARVAPEFVRSLSPTLRKHFRGPRAATG